LAVVEATHSAPASAETAKTAYQEIVGKELTGAALDFFNAENFYQSIAAARVVRLGVDPRRSDQDCRHWLDLE